jgi:hypothetical protein
MAQLQELGVILGLDRKTLLAAYDGSEENVTEDSETSSNIEVMKFLNVMAEAYRDQAAAFSAQVEILKNIRNEMARESTLATISTNLQKAMLDVQTLSSRQLGVAPTVLASLERIEKLAPGTLQQEADRTIGQIEKEAYTHDSAAALNR